MMNKLKNITVCVFLCFSSVFLSSFIADGNPQAFNEVRIGETDSDIISKIKKLYSADKNIKSLGIEVASSKGAVDLRGEVETQKEYEQAILLALSVNGVKIVHAQDLSIKASDGGENDVSITKRLRELLANNKLLGLKDSDAYNVSVDAESGVVYLSGVVSSKEEKEKIVKISLSLEGVKSVNSDYLTVR